MEKTVILNETEINLLREYLVPLDEIMRQRKNNAMKSRMIDHSYVMSLDSSLNTLKSILNKI